MPRSFVKAREDETSSYRNRLLIGGRIDVRFFFILCIRSVELHRIPVLDVSCRGPDHGSLLIEASSVRVPCALKV